jgi:hypothetical protein
VSKDTSTKSHIVDTDNFLGTLKKIPREQVLVLTALPNSVRAREFRDIS